MLCRSICSSIYKGLQKIIVIKKSLLGKLAKMAAVVLTVSFALAIIRVISIEWKNVELSDPKTIATSTKLSGCQSYASKNVLGSFMKVLTREYWEKTTPLQIFSYIIYGAVGYMKKREKIAASKIPESMGYQLGCCPLTWSF